MGSDKGVFKPINAPSYPSYDLPVTTMLSSPYTSAPGDLSPTRSRSPMDVLAILASAEGKDLYGPQFGLTQDTMLSSQDRLCDQKAISGAIDKVDSYIYSVHNLDTMSAMRADGMCGYMIGIDKACSRTIKGRRNEFCEQHRNMIKLAYDGLYTGESARQCPVVVDKHTTSLRAKAVIGQASWITPVDGLVGAPLQVGEGYGKYVKMPFEGEPPNCEIRDIHCGDKVVHMICALRTIYDEELTCIGLREGEQYRKRQSPSSHCSTCVAICHTATVPRLPGTYLYSKQNLYIEPVLRNLNYSMYDALLYNTSQYERHLYKDSTDVVPDDENFLHMMNDDFLK